MLNPLFAAAIASASASSPVLPQGFSDRAALSAIEERLLAAHNQERARVGALPLQWDRGLASSAASYGPALEALGRLVHSPRDGRPGQRENLWMGSRGAYSPEFMVGTWLAEKALLRPGIYPSVSSTGRWEDVSHYTQMVWPTTTHLGCAIHPGRSDDYLICRYSPPGNKDGTIIPLAWLR